MRQHFRQLFWRKHEPSYVEFRWTFVSEPEGLNRLASEFTGRHRWRSEEARGGCIASLFTLFLTTLLLAQRQNQANLGIILRFKGLLLRFLISLLLSDRSRCWIVPLLCLVLGLRFDWR
jgi:hypothetical protein